MARLTPDLERVIDHIPRTLESEFPHVPIRVIERTVQEELREFVASARFNDFVPLFVHRHVRDRLRDVN